MALFSFPMEMEVGMGLGVMGVGVQVEVLGSERTPQDIAPKDNQHQSYEKFQAKGDTRRNGQAQSDDDQAHYKECRCMAQNPEGPY